ncbi:amino acid ABC transporter permease [Roseovarius sp. S4756]|uniref:amino acid ABC transporter permease n=1 Tax=Roseovarius maritimus TaxID=3342637 RepID=UPI00372CDCC5
MPAILRKLRWPDLLLLAALAAGIGYALLRAEGTLTYEWRWHLIPDYILRWREDRGEWFANLLLQGLITTIRISIYASVLALILGVILGIARTARNLTIRLLARTYMELLRNIPPVVIIFIFFFFLSQQLIDALNLNAWARGVARSDNAAIWEFFFGDMRRFPSLISGVIVLALFESAFVGEIVRAGIQSVAQGQREAARAIGMGPVQEMRHIILPQAMRKVTPPMANQFISLIKDSSIISLISVQDLTYKTVELVASTRLIFEAWITTAALYFILCFGLSLLFRRLEGRQ